MSRSPKTTTLIDRLNMAMTVCWNSNKPITRQDIIDAYKVNPVFADRSIESIRASAHWDFSGLYKTGMFNVVMVRGKKWPRCKALVLKAKYRKQASAPIIDQVPGLPKPNGRRPGGRGRRPLIPNLRMVDVAKKAGCTYTTVYSALFRPNLISKATTKRVIRVIKSMGGDLSKVSQPHFRGKKVTIAVAPVPKPVISSPVNKTISWKVIPEKDAKPGDMARVSEGRMIFLRAL